MKKCESDSSYEESIPVSLTINGNVRSESTAERM